MAGCAIFTVAIPGLADDVKERGIDELNPIWNVLDLTPVGRGKFYASLDYGTKEKGKRQKAEDRDQKSAISSRRVASG
jgi:hypothetical protein